MTLKNFSIFISSCDSYSDLWDPFFKLFSQNCKRYEGIIYLNTESKDYSYPGLNIVCTKVGTSTFGKRIINGLQKVDSRYILFLMEDYFMMSPVNYNLLNDYFEFFKSARLDALYLTNLNYKKIKDASFKDVKIIIPPDDYFFCLQAGFWNKDRLSDLILPFENPWMTEINGTKRAIIERYNMAYTSIYELPYLKSGALRKNQWVPEMVNYLKEININLDFEKRGFYIETKASIFNRIVGKLKNLIPISLSMTDLAVRKFKSFRQKTLNLN